MKKADNRHHCDHCDKMFANPNNDDPDARTMCPQCEETGHHGGICLACKGEEEAQLSTALVVQRLSIVPQGDTQNALERADQFVRDVAGFLENSDRLVTGAEAFVINNDRAAQTADIMQDELKKEIKEWEDKRMAVTRPIDDLKGFIAGLPKPGIDHRRCAINIYQQKITAYRAKVREAELLAQREAERLLREERERLEAESRRREAEARRLEEKAQNLKTAAARQRAADEAAKAADDAARLREEAALVPESVAVATSASALAVSNIAQVWKGSIPLCSICQAAEQRPDPKRECPHNKKLALQTILAKWDEWHDVITFKPAGLNSMARKYQETLELPGLKFTPGDSFRGSNR